MNTAIINSWDAGDEELVNDIEELCKARSKRHPEGSCCWDIPNKRIIVYIDSQRYIIPFPPELDINDNTLKKLIYKL